MIQILIVLFLLSIILFKIKQRKNKRNTYKLSNILEDVVLFLKFIVFPLIFFICIYLCFVFYKVRQKYGDNKVHQMFMIITGQPFPLVIFTVFTFVYVLFEITSTGQENAENEEYQLEFDKAKWFDKLITRWEKTSLVDNDISKLYNDIIKKQHGETFYTENQWKTIFGNKIDFYDVADPKYNNKFRFVAIYIQEMTNLYRIFKLNDVLILGNKKDLIDSLTYNKGKGKVYTVVTLMRLWLSDDFVRNVWENTKKTMDSPNFCAWVQYFIIDPVQQDKKFWEKYSNSWSRDESELLFSLETKK
ncbi:hypothetical protein CPAV1605_356 [seawater metagenome]|uniref:Uncharacterized protein n=1 Tax=seawater metagenome TaxID=1561972 RepID=A0A5E8CHE0_9ZZZZ